MNPAEGYADALWTWTPSAGRPLSCVVEVKHCAVLQHGRDLEKFRRDVQTAVQTDRANAGLFLSLSSRVAGMRPLQFALVAGVPVLYASRAAEDALPAAGLVELAFHALAQAWPLLSRRSGEGVERTVLAVAEHFENQLLRCEELSKHVAALTRQGTQILRVANAVARVRDDVVSGITQLRMTHPELAVEADDGPEEEAAGGQATGQATGQAARGPPDLAAEVGTEAGALLLWETEEGKGVLAAIKEYKARHYARYPRALADLQLTEAELAFVGRVPNALLQATDYLKRRAKRRRAAEPEPVFAEQGSEPREERQSEE
jgi:hypothetical protein